LVWLENKRQIKGSTHANHQHMVENTGLRTTDDDQEQRQERMKQMFKRY